MEFPDGNLRRRSEGSPRMRKFVLVVVCLMALPGCSRKGGGDRARGATGSRSKKCASGENDCRRSREVIGRCRFVLFNPGKQNVRPRRAEYPRRTVCE